MTPRLIAIKAASQVATPQARFVSAALIRRTVTEFTANCMSMCCVVPSPAREWSRNHALKGKVMRLPVWMSVLLLLCASSSLFAQDRPTTPGTVSVVTSIRVLDGQADAWTNYLATEWKSVMEARDAAGSELHKIKDKAKCHGVQPDLVRPHLYRRGSPDAARTRSGGELVRCGCALRAADFSRPK